MNTHWKPNVWISVLLGASLHSFAFLYLNKPKIFWLYLVATLLLGVLGWYFSVTPYISIFFSILCSVHAGSIAKGYDSTHPRRWYSRWWGIPTIFAAIFISVFTIRSFFYEPFRLPSKSMSPTIKAGDNIIVKKYGYGHYGTYGINIYKSEIATDVKLERGKMYVFYPPEKNHTFVKRLIAMPGDSIAINDSSMILNGKKLENKLLQENETFALYEESIDQQTYTIQRSKVKPLNVNVSAVIPEGQYFFVGDNRDNSLDSRFLGPVPAENLVGEVVKILPLHR